ncbi:sulfite exporter TauE/SafE family protein [Photobacterium sp. DNB22_13_2]
MDSYILILGIILLSSVIQSTFSFGGALVALPLLIYFFDVGNAAALMTLMSFTVSIFVLASSWRNIDFKSASRLIISSCIGIPIGIYFVASLDESIVKSTLAATIILFSTLNLLKIKKTNKVSEKSAHWFGFISGVFAGAYGMGGPPVILFASLVGWTPSKFRTTIQAHVFATNIFAIASHQLVGNYNMEVITAYLYCLPVVILSVFIGSWAHNKISPDKHKKIVNYLLFLLGANLMLSTVW